MPRTPGTGDPVGGFRPPAATPTAQLTGLSA